MAARMMGANRSARALQLATADLRALPDFVIFGAAKCGTTALYDYLGAHPLVVACPTKEIHYADRPHNAAKGERWYRSWFPRRATLVRVGREQGDTTARCGEATPNYLAWSGAAAELARVVPGVRLVALLREPGDRAWSHYRKTHRPDPDPAAFLEMVQREADDHLAHGLQPTADVRQVRQGFLRQGHYADELAEWYAAFDAEQILLVRSEDMFADPAAAYTRVCHHIGLPDAALPSFAVVNETGVKRDLPPEARAWLDDHFAEPNHRLTELTDGAIVWP
jgi:Sulfotransferase domain